MAIPVAVPLVIGGSMLLSSWMQKEAVDRATDAQLSAADKAAQVQLEMFYQTRADLEPWMEAGKWALEQLVGWHETVGEKPKKEDFTTSPITVDTKLGRVPGAGIEKLPVFDEEGYNKALADWETSGTYHPGLIEQGPGEFEGSPGYEFRFGEGVKALERGASARGGVLSGATQKALVEYGQGFATSEYDKFIGRYYAKLNPLLQTAGMAPLATLGQTGSETGGNLANIAMGKGQSQAAGYINRANISGNILGQTANLATQYYMWDQAGMFGNNANQGMMSA